MKRTISLLLVLCCLLSLAGCGKSSAPAAERPSSDYYNLGSWMLQFGDDNTVEHYNGAEDRYYSGTWTAKGGKVTFAIPGSPLDGKAVPYEANSFKTEDGTYYAAVPGGNWLIDGTQGGMILKSDGSIVAYADMAAKTGKEIGAWSREGSRWSFLCPLLGDGILEGIYTDQAWNLGSITLTRDAAHVTIDIPTLCVYGIYNNDTQLLLMNEQLSRLPEGFTTQEDLTRILEPMQTTGDLRYSFQGVPVQLRAVNFFAEPKPLSECMVYSFRTEDTTGTFYMDSIHRAVGKATFEELLQSDVYSYTHDAIVYRSFIMNAINMELSGADVYVPGTSIDVVMEMQGELLSAFRITLTDVPYHEEPAAIPVPEVQPEADPEPAQEPDISLVQRDLLDDLETALLDAGVAADINRASGEVTMGSSVLFGTDSAALTAEGKAFLDAFIGVYAAVLTDPEFAPYVRQILFEGHTDSSGSYGYNKVLSQKRADAVMNYCIGLVPALAQVSCANGLASSSPVYTESGAEDAAASRRVTLRFILDLPEA